MQGFMCGGGVINFRGILSEHNRGKRGVDVTRQAQESGADKDVRRVSVPGQ